MFRKTDLSHVFYQCRAKREDKAREITIDFFQKTYTQNI